MYVEIKELTQWFPEALIQTYILLQHQTAFQSGVSKPIG